MYFVYGHSESPCVTRESFPPSFGQDLRALETRRAHALESDGRDGGLRSGEPEIAEECMYVIRDQDIRSFDVTMDNAALM